MRINSLRALVRAILVSTLPLIPGAALADINVVPAPFPALAPTADFPATDNAGNPIDVLGDVNAKGYHVSEIDGGVYWITDGNYHSLAIVHRKGVILVDAPQPLPFFPNMAVLAAVEEIAPGEEITHFIYSHAHTDHIGGAADVLDAFPNAKIIAHEDTRAILEAADDPNRPVPTHSFKKKKKFKIGGQRLELHHRGNTHEAGNTFVYLPDLKILFVVDIIYPGWVPFRRLALSNNIAGWIKGHEEVLTFDFDTLVGGHLTRLGTRDDVLVQQEYVQDIVESIDSIMDDANRLFTAIGTIDAVHGAFFSFSTQAKWALFSAFYDASTMFCADILDAKYIEGATPGDNPKALGGAETFNFSNCEAYFVARRLGVEK